ncbi:MAG TPA: flagellar hook-associated protein FlgL [Feifaniaceae bacterium]|nr:flagellar hook-associated protein FlgL [Feifaniaceae bacterium]
MRITTNMMTSSFLTNLNNNLSALENYQTQLSTGRRINKLSDDPVGVLGSMNARVKLARLEQYQKNVGYAQDILKQTETSLKEINKILQTAYERAVQTTSDTYEEVDREAAAAEIAQLKEHILNLGNTKVSDQYIFGGYNSVKPPFTLDAAGNLLYNGLDVRVNDAALQDQAAQNMKLELGFDITMTTTINGIELLGSGTNNIYNLLQEFETALSDGSPSSVLGGFITKFQTVQSDVMAMTAEVGARSNRLTLMENRYADDEINYTDIKSKVEDADQAEVIMRYKMAESIYLFALKIGSNIIQPTLVDYLK